MWAFLADAPSDHPCSPARALSPVNVNYQISYFSSDGSRRFRRRVRDHFFARQQKFTIFAHRVFETARRQNHSLRLPLRPRIQCSMPTISECGKYRVAREKILISDGRRWRAKEPQKNGAQKNPIPMWTGTNGGRRGRQGAAAGRREKKKTGNDARKRPFATLLRPPKYQPRKIFSS